MFRTIRSCRPAIRLLDDELLLLELLLHEELELWDELDRHDDEHDELRQLEHDDDRQLDELQLLLRHDEEL